MESSDSKRDVDEKYYVSDHNGKRVSDKINTIATLNTLTRSQHIIISTLPLQSIVQRKLGLKNTLSSLLSSLSNDNYKNQMNQLEAKYGSKRNEQQIESIERIGYLLYGHAKRLEYEVLVKGLREESKESEKLQESKQQVRSGFRLYHNNNQPSTNPHIT